MAESAKNSPLQLKVPPQSTDAERAVLGAILIDPEAINKVLETFNQDGSDFYVRCHKELFVGMVSLFDKNVPIDMVTISDLFKDSTALNGVGGLSYIGELAESVPTSANVSHYAGIVKSKSLLRKVITSATDIARMGYDNPASVEEFLDDAERLIFEVSQDRIKKSIFAVKDIVKDAFETIEKLYEKKEHITGVATGFDDLDNLTAGFQNSDLIIIAGRPSMGKTAFAIDIAEHAAINENLPVVIFSLEMSKEQLVQRMLASRARVGLSNIRNGKLKDQDWPKLTTAVGVLYDAPIYVDDTPAQTVLEIRAKARRWKAEHDVKLIVVDYLQLVRGRSGTDSREQEISDISRSLKALAKELQVPVVALSQLSRKTEQREGNRPMLSDLRESGAIEQDADVVMFVYREYVYTHLKCKKDECMCENKNDAEIIVLKQRNGPTGNIHLTFLGEYTRFENQINTDFTASHTEWVEE